MIKQLLIMLLILVPVSLAIDMEKVYFVELNYDNDIISLNNIDLNFSYVQNRINMPEQGYKIELVDANHNVKYNYTFNFELFVSGAPVLELVETTKLLIVPYNFAAKEIEVYSPESELLLTIDVSEHSDYCGDGKCTDIEQLLECSEDCEGEILEEPPTNYLKYIIILSVIILSLILFILIKRKNNIYE
jgi:hypothetical protein